MRLGTRVDWGLGGCAAPPTWNGPTPWRVAPQQAETTTNQRKDNIMSFVQVIDYKSSKPDEIHRIHDEWTEATKGKRRAKRLLLAKYHDDPSSFCEIVFFDSYEDAMKNSQLPETKEFAKRLKNAIDGEPTYFDLDVVEEKTL
jgi:quinol monooxygenase YgiN